MFLEPLFLPFYGGNDYEAQAYEFTRFDFDCCAAHAASEAGARLYCWRQAPCHRTGSLLALGKMQRNMPRKGCRKKVMV